MVIRIFQPVGEGGQAIVYMAENDSGERIAVKILKEKYRSDPEYVERFRREVAIMQKLEHPGVVKVQTLEMQDGSPAYMMPRATGSLTKEIEDNPWGLPESTVLRVFSAVLNAIEYAHSRNVLHRDIKADNVLYIDGQVQVSDFGLARRMDSLFPPLTQSHIRVGTPGYAAPEVWNGGAKHADVAADIYSLGALLYHMFSVQHPQHGIDISKVPSQYRDLIVRATDHLPARRYSNVSDLISALELRQSGPQHLQVPEETALALIGSYQQGVAGSAAALGELLCTNERDGQLFLNVVPKISGSMLRSMELADRDVLIRVLSAFYGFIDRQHAFAITDSYGAFLYEVWSNVTDVQIRLSILEPLLLLGWSHNRYPVRTIFVRAALQAARDPQLVYRLGDILRENMEAKIFVRDELLAQSVPGVIRNILLEEPPAADAQDGAAWF
ncbi:serine/threonine-protein kinase [Arthrobacter koreensis]|uniref:serine/threonine-protein kinase n=1 Tax=Arthrobacter koreensis TaxID=199136 RepID=UPI00363F4F53